MPIAKANGIEIAYETFGNRSDRPLLLIMGLGMQMLAGTTTSATSSFARDTS